MIQAGHIHRSCSRAQAVTLVRRVAGGGQGDMPDELRGESCQIPARVLRGPAHLPVCHASSSQSPQGAAFHNLLPAGSSHSGLEDSAVQLRMPSPRFRHLRCGARFRAAASPSGRGPPMSMCRRTTNLQHVAPTEHRGQRQTHGGGGPCSASAMCVARALPARS